jgi:hypothetical protein
VLLLQENISKGQRIEHFKLEAWIGGNWKQVTEGTTVGYKRLILFSAVKTNKVRFTIDQSRLEPLLAEFGLYRQLPVVVAKPSSASFRESTNVELSCDDNKASIYFTTDGSVPDSKSQKYTRPIHINKTTELRFIAIRNDGSQGFVNKASFSKAENGITLVNAPDEKYSGGGPLGLVDGATGSIDFADGHWSGFNGTDLEALINFGSVKNLHEFGINFNETTKSWIFGPQQVEFLVSDDGINYKSIFTKSFEKPEMDREQIIHVSFDFICKARYVKIKAINYGKLPDWHPGKGEPAWLFADEIIAK